MGPGQLVHMTWLAFISLLCHAIAVSVSNTGEVAHTYPDPHLVHEQGSKPIGVPAVLTPFKIHCIVSKTSWACSDTNRGWHKVYPRGGVPLKEVTGSETAQ